MASETRDSDPRPVTYWLNGRRRASRSLRTTSARLLAAEGLVPVKWYRLEAESPDGGPGSSLPCDGAIVLTGEPRLIAIYVGPCPVA